MRLFALLVAGAVLGAVPALAQSAPPAGRYQIEPDEDGFVRLDTETGAMSHCVKRAGSWQCDVLAVDRSAADARIESLAREVDALTRKVDSLSEQLGKSTAQDGGATAGVPPQDPEFDQALSFAERLMQRFFDMVRQLKAEESAERI